MFIILYDSYIKITVIFLALYALEEMSKRIKEDNDNAMKFAKLLSEYDFVKIKMESVQGKSSNFFI